MELDFLYVPSADVAADATYWVNVLGASLDHLEDQRTILIYRVEDLVRTEKELRSKGWKRGRDVAKHFVGRTDFPIGPASEKPAKRPMVR